MPGYDRERVYLSDIKKLFNWYNLLQTNDLLKLAEEEVQEEATAEEKPKKKAPAKDKVAPKVSAAPKASPKASASKAPAKKAPVQRKSS